MLDESLFSHQRQRLTAQVPVISMTPSSGETVHEMATAILARAPARFALAGVSMGGIVALEIWRQTRDRVSHLALISTTPLPDHPQRRLIRDAQVARALNGELHDVLIESMKPLYLGRRARSDRKLLDRILHMGLTLGAEVFRRQSSALQSRPDSRDTLPSIDCPALVLCGGEDAICPLELHVDTSRRIPRADLVVLAECGHLPTLERPEAVSHHLQSLLERT
ncbi:MAG: alpha/beta hydrolase [Gammaproteobacteria bacterium]|nr:alpha/beta hydrolase [Gammaproteobacteria bacterium]